MPIVEYDAAARAHLLYDDALAGRYDRHWFDRAHWESAGARIHSATGRQSVPMLAHGDETWVLRHYCRGGAVARLVYDHYLWLGAERTRSFREWRLLHALHAEGFPVATPVAARALRRGLVYQADIITRLLPDTRPLSAWLLEDETGPVHWRRIGQMLKRFLDRGVDHPDLTAHNILLDASGAPFLVDFDNARLRAPGDWAAARLARLERSLRKVAAETGTDFNPGAWQALEDAYRRGG